LIGGEIQEDVIAEKYPQQPENKVNGDDPHYRAIDLSVRHASPISINNSVRDYYQMLLF
jgi:hypothetical protein